jgi:hypothetical protein
VENEFSTFNYKNVKSAAHYRVSRLESLAHVGTGHPSRVGRFIKINSRYLYCCKNGPHCYDFMDRTVNNIKIGPTYPPKTQMLIIQYILIIHHRQLRSIYSNIRESLLLIFPLKLRRETLDV